jgi:hypothetical protein
LSFTLPHMRSAHAILVANETAEISLIPNLEFFNRIDPKQTRASNYQELPQLLILRVVSPPDTHGLDWLSRVHRVIAAAAHRIVSTADLLLS